jgi:hypothetical protein
MQPIARAVAAALILGVTAAGCSSTDTKGADGSGGAGSPGEPATHSEHSEHAEHTEHEQDGSEAGHAQGHHEHGSEHGSGHDEGHGQHASGRAALVTAADLPVGYRAGHAHHVADEGAAPDDTTACEPLAGILRPHDDGQHEDHPTATATFAKSHFGPTITETVVDYAGTDAAAAALDDVITARGECDRYVQSRSPIGANTYEVQPLHAPSGSEPGLYLRLDALGSDFDGIRWDVWVHDCGGKLVALSHRNARGGDNSDFWPAVKAAMAKQHAA